MEYERNETPDENKSPRERETELLRANIEKILGKKIDAKTALEVAAMIKVMEDIGVAPLERLREEMQTRLEPSAYAMPATTASFHTGGPIGGPDYLKALFAPLAPPEMTGPSGGIAHPPPGDADDYDDGVIIGLTEKSTYRPAGMARIRRGLLKHFQKRYGLKKDPP